MKNFLFFSKTFKFKKLILIKFHEIMFALGILF